MPYISRHERARGSYRSPAVTAEHRGSHYTVDDLGPRCARCGMPMVRALAEAEPRWDTHPACPAPDPECRKCAGIDDRWHDRGCPNAPPPRRRRK